MSENITFIAGLLSLKDGNEKTRVFIPSQNINVFPCSRRGQITLEGSKLNCDPEARLNTERTNRLRTSINGFKDSFIDSFTKDKDENGNELDAGTLVFALAGYRIEIKEFNSADIATALGITDGTIYAHLSLHDGVPFGVANYYTEILYRQSTKTVEYNYIDVEYSDGSSKSDFFMGVSFTTEKAFDIISVGGANKQLEAANLPLFSKSDNGWELVQTSLLPRIEHDTEPDSIKLSGDFTVEHTKANGEKQTSFKVTKDKTTLGPTEISELDVTGDFTVKQVSGEDEEISFEITKHGVGTVNVPLHITKATTIDGSFRASTAASVKNLIVGEITQSEVYPTEGTIKAKKHIETPTLEATESIKTPALDVKTIKNAGTEAVTVDEDLTVTGNLVIAAGKAVTTDTVNVNTINSRQENGTITVESPVILNGNATLDKNLTVGTDDDTSTGTITAKNLVKTPTLNVNSLTSDGAEVKINKPINVTGKATLNNGLQVTTGDTDLQKLITTELAVATDALTVTKDEAKFIKPVTVDSSLTANNVQITGQGQVPALELYHFKNGPYQLRFKFNTAPTIIEEK